MSRANLSAGEIMTIEVANLFTAQNYGFEFRLSVWSRSAERAGLVF